MMYLDTHLLIWLYAGSLELIPPKVGRLIEDHDLLISPMCELEVEYLYETKRIKSDAKTILADLATRVGLTVCSLPFEKVVSMAVKESWTRDPFDRVICAQARLRGLPLLTKDKAILKHYSKAVWRA